MKEKTYNILEELFYVKRPIENFLSVIFILFVGVIMKIGLITSKEIVEGKAFNAFVWASLIVILAFIIIMIFGKTEGIFALAGGILMLMIIAPTQFFKPQISIYLVIVGIVGWIVFVVLEDINKSKKKKTSQNRRNRKLNPKD